MWSWICERVRSHFGVTGVALYNVLLTCCAFDMLLFGYDQGVFGGILTIDSFVDQFDLRNNETMKGLIVATYNIVCFGGALFSGKFGHRLGRKRSIRLGTWTMVLGALLQTWSQDTATMIAGRVISGLGNGLNTANGPVWASEASPAAKRGSAGVMLMSINIFGLAVSCFVTYGCSFLSGTLAWRAPLGFQLIFCFGILSLEFWMPESPRWLVMRGQHDGAKAALAALAGKGTTLSQVNAAREDKPSTELAKKVAAEFEEIQRKVQAEQSPTITRNIMPRFRLLLGVGAQAMQQFTGINVICYYLPYVLTESVGLKASEARIISAVNALTYLAATSLTKLVIEKWGRRRLMFYGALGQMFCWMTITILLTFADKASIKDSSSLNEPPLPSPNQATEHSATTVVTLSSVAILFFFLFNICFGFGWQSTSWVYPSEINSNQMRILGMSLGVATNWAINFVVVLITPLGIAKLGAYFYIIWTVCDALISVIVWLFYAETANRSLEAIDDMFESHNTIWAGFNKGLNEIRPSEMQGDSEEGSFQMKQEFSHSTSADTASTPNDAEIEREV